MKKRIIAIVVILIVAALGYMVIRNRSAVKPEAVKTAVADTGDIQTWLSTNALVESKESKDYYGTSGLSVEKVYVKVGDKVKKGDKILEYDLTDLETSVEQAKIQYDNAVLNLSDLLNQKARIEQDIADTDADILRLNGSTNPQDLATLQGLIQKRDAMQTISDEKVKLSQNSVDLAKIGLDAAQTRLNKVKDGIPAEADGTVTALNAVEGAPLAMSQPAAVVQDLTRLKGVIQLGKYDAAKIKLGQKVVLDNSGKTYDGTVSFIDPAASKTIAAQDAVLEAEIDINNPDDSLKVDFDVNADILTAEAKGILKLPVECIKYDKDNNTSVFVVEGGKAKIVQVSLGIQSDTEAQVLGGLKQGDQVIMNPSISIADGVQVIGEGASK